MTARSSEPHNRSTVDVGRGEILPWDTAGFPSLLAIGPTPAAYC